MPPRAIVILQTGDAPPDVERISGNYDRLFSDAAQLKTGEVEVVHLPAGERPGDPGDYRGILITGSSAMVTDRLPWSEFAADWLRRAMAAQVPIFGVCYGHQLLAYALGGEVDFHPDGMEVGTQRIDMLDEAAREPLLGSLPARFGAHLIHSQTVTVPPPGATVLARSSQDAHQILRYRDNVLTVQFHPEFTADVMRGFVRCMAQSMPEQQHELANIGRQVAETPVSRSLMARFVRTYMTE
ncbi:glutamine amidotransferase [Martelella alba]|uniref:Glutamine amidotransferase n=2 Tax=Martelella alba TaxID=2590451 RepID=A0ABY2SMY6_9HYPH|nr:glutamine amidotransferase [Martelella alba]